MGTTGIVIVVIAVAIIAAVVAAVLLRRRSSVPVAPPEPPKAPHSDVEPMSGLETALSQVTDRAGRPIKDAIDAETAHVDDLRVPDDTGPLLRRALDHVTPHDANASADADIATDTGDDVET